MNTLVRSFIAAGLLAATAVAQTEQAYEQSEGEVSRSILDPSRFSISHSLSFGMSSASGSDLKSQSLYSTMIAYRFAKPVTLNLNFGLPIHSTYSSGRNLTMENIESLEYFKNMPFDVSMTWQPRDNMLLRLSVTRQSVEDYYGYGSYLHSPYLSPWLGDAWK
jgi:spore coat protein U-like protein